MTSRTTADDFAALRRRMVVEQIRSRGLTADDILSAMRTVPRHLFVPPDLQDRAYEDSALPLAPGRSISQPYIVAMMTHLATPLTTDRVLEIGTGSGYQAAVLAELTPEVFTIESDPVLAAHAAQRFERLHYRSVRSRCGDGRLGWPEAAPFAAILVTACTEDTPRALLDQLAPGGRLVIPAGATNATQMLTLITKDAEGHLSTRQVMPVRFVPLE